MSYRHRRLDISSSSVRHRHQMLETTSPWRDYMYDIEGMSLTDIFNIAIISILHHYQQLQCTPCKHMPFIYSFPTPHRPYIAALILYKQGYTLFSIPFQSVVHLTQFGSTSVSPSLLLFSLIPGIFTFRGVYIYCDRWLEWPIGQKPSQRSDLSVQWRFCYGKVTFWPACKKTQLNSVISRTKDKTSATER